jgi:hypothetical protein
MADGSTIGLDPRELGNAKHRLSSLYTVINKNGQPEPFRPNDAQLQFYDELHSRNIILKARQLGFTTFCCLIYLDACLFHSNTRAAVIAHKLQDAQAFFKDKVKFPYDMLPDQLKDRIPAIQDSAESFAFANNSSIRVSASVRSGTFQYLHVSEFGKMCASFPEKAREVVTGSLNTVPKNGFVVIESTAEGQDGAFYRMTQEARRLKEAGAELTDLDYRFHFFPWWQDRSYSLPGAYVAIDEESARYFDQLAADGIPTTSEQQAWYVKTEATQEGDMKREYPSTPDEAFEQALEGAYFSLQLAVANRQRRIGGYPYDPRYKVNTFWDLGRNDNTVIWLHQYIGGYHRFIGYYENSGEFIGHYVKWLRDWAEERQATFGDHYMPHDGDRQSLWLEGGTLSVMEGLKFSPQIVQRPENKLEAITAGRSVFLRCQFDQVGCSVGLKRLRAYRKEWDDLRGVWKDRPLHDINSHGADGFLTFACAPITEVETLVKTPATDRHRRRLYANSGGSWRTA